MQTGLPQTPDWGAKPPIATGGVPVRFGSGINHGKTRPAGTSNPALFAGMPPGDSAQFGHKTDAQRVKEERDRLRSQDYPSLVRAAFQMPKMLLQSFRFPTPLMVSLPGIRSWFKSFRACDHSYENRAIYNVTGNADYLNRYLPYRGMLTAKGDTAGLARYEKLVADIQDKIGFYQTDQLENFSQKLDEMFMSPAYDRDIHAHARKIGGLIDFNNDEEARGILFKHLAEVKEIQLADELDKLKPLQDKATHYTLAANLAELFINHPEYIDQVLDKEPTAGEKHPLRFVVGGNAPLLAAATFRFMYNVITVNGPSLWMPGSGSTASQHEFIHAFSVRDDQPQGTLPVMSAAQIERFKAARETLFTQFRENDDNSFGRLKHWFTGKNSTGLPNYAFYNPLEFLTVTLDEFKMAPARLRASEPGRVIYDIYKEIFDLDPAEDYRAFFTPLQDAEAVAGEAKDSPGPDDAPRFSGQSATGQRLRQSA